MDQQDFPDLDAAATSGSAAGGNQPAKSKADSAMIFGMGASVRGARDGAAAGEENKAGPTKPVFRGKAKLQTGGASNEEV